MDPTSYLYQMDFSNMKTPDMSPYLVYPGGMDYNMDLSLDSLTGMSKDSLVDMNYQFDPNMTLETNTLSRNDSSSSQLTSDHLTTLPPSNYYPAVSYPFMMNADMSLPLDTSSVAYWSGQPGVTHGHPPKRVYSFVTMSQSKTKKRLRRKFDEIDRLFDCNHGSCNKAYGTLNNLNAHILMQSHGPKRTAAEFKEKLLKLQSQQRLHQNNMINTNNQRPVATIKETYLRNA